jgi:galactokinase
VIERLGWTGTLHDLSGLASRLAEAGLKQPAAAAKAVLFGRVLGALESCRPITLAQSPAAFFVPGRIEVLGKHTDYAGGRSMTVATEQGFCLAVLPRSDAEVVVIDAARNERVQFQFNPELTPSVGHWSNYPMTVARRIARNFPNARRGATIALASDLPPAAGMSSSSALMVAVFLALAHVNDLAAEPAFQSNIHNPTDLAGYLGTVENGQTFGSLVGDRGVGTFGGSEDHTAMLCSLPGHISQYAYCPVRFERAIALPSGYTFAVAVSGVAAEKTGAAMEKYNAASRLASALADLWRQNTGRTDLHLAAILASDPKALTRLREIVQSAVPSGNEPDALLRRLEHFVAENERILSAAGDSLEHGDVVGFGRLVSQSQEAAETLLGNQIPETSYLAHSASDCGAVAASAFGAGFGGSVWALVQENHVGPFLNSWAEAYRRRFPERAEAAWFFQTWAGPAAMQIV